MIKPSMTIIMLVRAMQSSTQVVEQRQTYLSRTSVVVAFIVALATTCQQLVGAT